MINAPVANTTSYPNKNDDNEDFNAISYHTTYNHNTEYEET